MLTVLLASLLITSCGGGSSRSEGEVAALVRGHGGYAVECVKSSAGAGYDCTALTDGSHVPVRLAVTVDQSGGTVFVTHCEAAKKSSRGKPCSEIH
ncbi:MAG TPA: hypothetical protein VH268_05995 [Solirubrobacterales bacterium]|nr:hypothetical protein [Solirubrobacterales bacterium]